MDDKIEAIAKKIEGGSPFGWYRIDAPALLDALKSTEKILIKSDHDLNNQKMLVSLQKEEIGLLNRTIELAKEYTDKAERHKKLMRDAMQLFCDRVEKHEVHSQKTYASFIEILKETAQ